MVPKWAPWITRDPWPVLGDPWIRFCNGYFELGRWWGTSKHNCLVSYLLCWQRHVSATVGHLQFTKMYVEENYTDYDHSIGAYCKLSTSSLCWLDYTYWAKSTSSEYSIRMDIQTLQKHPCGRHRCTKAPETLGTPLALHSVRTYSS